VYEKAWKCVETTLHRLWCAEKFVHNSLLLVSVY
jgi:hypothetical protein